jgi:hypothetical protein
MPHDLYGTYYASATDALNAEMAQCAAIDASIAQRDLNRLREERYYDRLREGERLAQIEERLALLEKFIPISLCEEGGK